MPKQLRGWHGMSFSRSQWVFWYGCWRLGFVLSLAIHGPRWVLGSVVIGWGCWFIGSVLWWAVKLGRTFCIQIMLGEEEVRLVMCFRGLERLALDNIQSVQITADGAVLQTCRGPRIVPCSVPEYREIGAWLAARLRMTGEDTGGGLVQAVRQLGPTVVTTRLREPWPCSVPLLVSYLGSGLMSLTESPPEYAVGGLCLFAAAFMVCEWYFHGRRYKRVKVGPEGVELSGRAGRLPIGWDDIEQVESVRGGWRVVSGPAVFVIPATPIGGCAYQTMVGNLSCRNKTN